MNIIIIEDEKPALEKLRLQLNNYQYPVNILVTLSGVQESVEWLNENAHPDLIFCDIALSDGISFDIFRQV
ncbi:MAG TPA: response regulator, partial [Chitinophagales bacterium]|nr:response regulator [Chitinophagales bacterium]HRH52005.1 response regulator [Chitinophagales bacterium]